MNINLLFYNVFHIFCIVMSLLPKKNETYSSQCQPRKTNATLLCFISSALTGLLWCLLMINPGPGINPICFAVNTTEHNCSPIFRSNKTTFLSSNKGNANNIFHIFLWTSTCCQIFIFVYLFYQFYPILHPWLMSPDVAVWLQLVSTMFVHWMSSDRHLWGQL